MTLATRQTAHLGVGSLERPIAASAYLTGLHGLAVHQGRSDDAQNLIAEVMALAQEHPGTNLMAQALFAAAFGEVAW